VSKKKRCCNTKCWHWKTMSRPSKSGQKCFVIKGGELKSSKALMRFGNQYEQTLGNIRNIIINLVYCVSVSQPIFEKLIAGNLNARIKDAAAQGKKAASQTQEMLITLKQT